MFARPMDGTDFVQWARQWRLRPPQPTITNVSLNSREADIVTIREHVRPVSTAPRLAVTLLPRRS